MLRIYIDNNQSRVAEYELPFGGYLFAYNPIGSDLSVDKRILAHGSLLYSPGEYRAQPSVERIHRRSEQVSNTGIALSMSQFAK